MGGFEDLKAMIVGGDERAYADEIGADAHGPNAAAAVYRCREFAQAPATRE